MKQIKTLDDLRLQKLALKMKLHQSELAITSDWNYLRFNAKKLIWRQINPFKNSEFVDGIISALQPTLLPLIVDLTKTDDAGKPLSTKLLSSGIKYLIATLGLKWIRSFIQSRNQEDNEPSMENEQLNNQQ